MTTDRTDWYIRERAAWLATYRPTGHLIIAHTKAELMSKINQYEKTL